MIEAIAIPILLKAVEFLFGEGSKILEERRERRNPQQEAEKETHKHPAPQSGGATKSSEVIQSKEVALSQPIAEAAWSDSEAKVKHLLSLLEIYSKNYYLAKEQYALWGNALVPPIILHNLTEAENGVAATTKKLQLALSTIYGKQVTVSEVEQA